MSRNMAESYQLIDDHYVLFFKDEVSPLNKSLEEVSLGFIKNGEFLDLARHGDLHVVTSWKARVTKDLLKFKAGQESIDALTIVTGKFPINELNDCLLTENGLKTMIDRMQKEEQSCAEDDSVKKTDKKMRP